MSNPFSKFTTEERTVYIPALDAEVKLRDLTIKEEEEISRIMFKNVKLDGGQQVADINDINRATLLTISKALVEPKMGVADLEKLSVSASKALEEIYAEINKVKSGEAVEKK